MIKSFRSKVLAAVVALGGLALSAHAWVYPEHRAIALLAVERLDPERKALLERLWREARTGHEQRLCEQVADGQQGVAPACIDWAALSAIAGDHSCSSKNMLDNVLADPVDPAGGRRGGATEAGSRTDRGHRPARSRRAHDGSGRRYSAPDRGRGAARAARERAAHVGHPAAAGRPRIRHPRRLQQRALPDAAAAHRHHAEGVRRVDAQRRLRDQRDRRLRLVPPECLAESHAAGHRAARAGATAGARARDAGRRSLRVALPARHVRCRPRGRHLGRRLAAKGHARPLQRRRAGSVHLEGQQRIDGVDGRRAHAAARMPSGPPARCASAWSS